MNTRKFLFLELPDDLTAEEVRRRLDLPCDAKPGNLPEKELVTNQPQMEKLLALFDFLQDVAIELEGEVEPLDLHPSTPNGCVRAIFPTLSLCGMELEEFGVHMKNCSSTSIDSLDDGSVCIFCTVPNVYIKA